MIPERLFKSSVFPYVLILALALVSYGNALAHEFYLDEVMFFNPKDGIGLSSGASLILQGFQGIFRPAALLLYKLLHMAFGQNPIGYHAANLIMFIATGWLFFYILHNLLNNEKLALLAASLYTVHPINNLLVNYKTGSGLILFILLMQLGTVAWMHFLREKKWEWYFVCLLLYALSLFSHELSISLPLYLILITYFFYREKWAAVIRYMLPFATVLLLFILLRSQIDQRPIGAWLALPIGWTSYVAALFPLAYWYISRLIVPVEIILVNWTVIAADGSLFILNLMFWLTVFVCVYLFTRWKKSVLSFALGFFLTGFIFYVPASLVYAHLGGKVVIIEPHWFAFASIGFFTLTAYGLLSLKPKIPSKAWRAGLALIFLTLILLARQHNAFWKNERAYLNFWLKANPKDITARSALRALEEKGR